MAVYTKVSEEALAEFISFYDIGPVSTCKGIAEGIENTNYKITTDTGQYILTLYEKRVDKQQLPFFLGLMDHLSGQEIPCPVPLHAQDGTLSRQLCDRPAALFSFLPGIWPRIISDHHCHELGGWLARLHLAGRDFGKSRDNDLSLASWRPLLMTCDSDATNDISSGLYDELLRELDYLEQHWPAQTELPKGIIHADLFPDNVFFEGSHISGMIDFYFACTDAFAYDIAICLNAWCFDSENRFVQSRAENLLKGYCLLRELSPDELNVLPLLARGSAIRFLLTRLYDWVNTPQDALVVRKDPTELLIKLKFHQQVNDYRDYGLEHSLS